VQHLYPGTVNNVVVPSLAGWQEPREGEEEAGTRGQPLGQNYYDGAKLCQDHLLSPLLSTEN